jgi:hypothetical protein
VRITTFFDEDLPNILLDFMDAPPRANASESLDAGRTAKVSGGREKYHQYGNNRRQLG